MQRDSPEIQVALYLVGDPIEPLSLNALLNVEQEIYIAKGDPRVVKGNVRGFHKTSTWGFCSVQAIASDEIDNHADWLCSKVENAIDVLRSKPSREAFIEITIVTTFSISGSFVLPANLLELARKLDAKIGVGMRYQPTTHRPITNTAG